ncbi:hypothetical protein ACVWZM_006940 [Bradyrhizobium sp. USDA 4501]
MVRRLIRALRRCDLDLGDWGQPGRDRAASPLLTSRSLFAFMAAFWPNGGSILVVRDVHRVGIVVGSLAAIRHRLDGFDHMPSYYPGAPGASASGSRTLLHLDRLPRELRKCLGQDRSTQPPGIAVADEEWLLSLLKQFAYDLRHVVSRQTLPGYELAISHDSSDA